MVRVALVGASGYTGTEALRLLLQHPQVEITMLCAGRQAGKRVSEITPSFFGLDLPAMVPFDAKAVAAVADFAFLGLPHGTAQTATAELLAEGVKVIDLSADHRFDDPAFYSSVYAEHAFPESLSETVYGLPELNRDTIRTTRLVGCPGCYPTSVILAAHPVRTAGILSSDELIADSKSGVSGAGRNPSAGTHFPETADGLHAYKTLAHRHAPEMGRMLDGMNVRFVPHLVPLIRGILSTVYLRLKPGVDEEQVRRIYEDAYGEEPFVHVLDAGLHRTPSCSGHESLPPWPLRTG